MKHCVNCIWKENCGGVDERCDFYTPADGFEHIQEREYAEELRKREKAYSYIIKDFAEEV